MTSSNHRFGGQPVRGRMRPQPDAMAEHERRQFLDVFRIDLGTPVLQQRPHLREPAPADDGPRRGAQVDAALDQIRGRVVPPVGVFVVGPRRRHQPLDVAAEPIVQKHALADHGPQLDDALLRQQRVEPHLLEVEVDQLLLLLGRQVADVDHGRKPIGRRFRERKRALPQLHRVHRRNREAERRQLVGRLADGDGAVLQAPRETRSAT